MKHFTIITQGQSASVGCPPGARFSFIRKYVMVMGFLFFSGLAIGQVYLPLQISNAVWSVSEEKSTMMGDTVINETTYSKVYYHYGLTSLNTDSLVYRCALRQDLEGGKVWAFWKDSQQEKLLYDFSLEIGQQETVTCAIYFGGTYDAEQEFVIEVGNIDTIDIDGVQRRRLEINSEFFHNPVEYWIEGIGSTYGLLYPGTSCWSIVDFPIPLLVCYEEDGQNIYQVDEDCYDIPTVGIKEINQESLSVSVYPSLVRDAFIVKSIVNIDKIIVYDLGGRKVFEINENGLNEHHINAAHWTKGIYFVTAFSGSMSKTTKIVKY